MDLAEFLASLKPRNQNAQKPRDWFRVGNLVNGEAEIFIYDFIGFDPFFGGVSAQQFVSELRGLHANKILLRINSPGGDVHEAVAMRTALAEHPAEVETHIDGAAWSAASWLGLVGDRVIMAPHSTMMIHEPWTIAGGDAKVMAKEAEILDKLANEIAEMLAEKAGGAVDDWRSKMREETWFTDQEAVDAGLADEVGGEASAENRQDRTIANAMVSLFKNAPDSVKRAEPRATPKAAITPPAEATPPHELIHEALRYQREESRRLGVAV